jgi:hypothetical protein
MRFASEPNIQPLLTFELIGNLEQTYTGISTVGLGHTVMQLQPKKSARNIRTATVTRS